METIPSLREVIEEAVDNFNKRQSYLSRHQLNPTEKKGLISFLITTVQSNVQKVLENELEHVYEAEDELEQLEYYVNVIKLLLASSAIDGEASFSVGRLERYSEHFLAIDYNEVDKEYKISLHDENPETSVRSLQ